MNKEEFIKTSKEKFNKLNPFINEKIRRVWCAIESESYGYGGISFISEATGISRTTIYEGKKLLKGEDIEIQDEQITRQRKAGGGRKKLTEKHPELLKALEQLVDPVSRGDPESPLRWTCKSTYKLSKELKNQGYKVSQRSVWELLSSLDYSMQSNKKTKEGNQHPDRDAQFNYIYETVKEFQKDNNPVISVDTKKKELIGEFKNNGKEYQPKGQPEQVNGHDFQDKELGKVAPYGVYDQTNNEGFVNVGINHDTAEFAVASIRRWWKEMGQQQYKDAKSLLITADCGGSNGYRVRLWKTELQKLSDEIGLGIQICHFPPGTSKWNKIEHKMFSYISQNWRGRPLISREVVVNLISNTTTEKGLTIKAIIDENLYEKGKKITDEELATVNLIKDKFHGEWNYKICPNIK